MFFNSLINVFNICTMTNTLVRSSRRVVIGPVRRGTVFGNNCQVELFLEFAVKRDSRAYHSALSSNREFLVISANLLDPVRYLTPPRPKIAKNYNSTVPWTAPGFLSLRGPGGGDREVKRKWLLSDFQPRKTSSRCFGR